MKIPCFIFLLAPVLAYAVSEPEPAGLDEGTGVHEVPADEFLLENEDPTVNETELSQTDPLVAETADELPVDHLIPEAYWQAYLGQRPEKHIVDPQKLLSPLEYRDRLAFLNYHAGDSAIDIFVYLIGPGQEIPEEMRLEELTERWFSSSKPSVVVHYFMSQPERTFMMLSPAIRGAVSAAERNRALESAIMQALAEAEPARQFEALLMQLSIRIYGMETLMDEAEATTLTAPASKAPVAVKKKRPEPKSPYIAVMTEAQKHLMPASAIAGGVLLIAVVRFWLKRRARYVFPDFEVEPRLGGAHAAGVGAVISFASATVPPASQRDAMPDYLRRA